MKTVLVAVVVLVLLAIVGVGAFFAGSAYGQSQAQNTRAEFFRERLAPAGGQGNMTQMGQQGQRTESGRIAANGTVKSVQGNTLQVTAQDGSTVTVTVDAQTVIQKTITGTAADLQPGLRVTVMSDQTGNNVAARVIQIRPGGQ